MTRAIEVCTPGRLHFGLSSFGGTGRQFSGLGMMVDGVGVKLRVSAADSFRAIGLHCERVEEFAKHWAAHQSFALPASEVEVVSAPPDHVGLGVGTQLGLAVVAGLSEYFEREWRDANLLCEMSGRGRRSAVGTHGFLRGGMIVDGGKLPDESVGRLKTRVEVPSEWRFLLIRPSTTQGLAGPAESQALSSLPAVPSKVTASLQSIINDEILPAVRLGNFEQFSHALYCYGHQAGNCFASVQGGAFASAEIATLVEHVRGLGYPGVGQSSWGPTVFTVAENVAAAKDLTEHLQQDSKYSDYNFTITQPDNAGAAVDAFPTCKANAKRN